ncbi:hypothetical protein LR48_Vigan02g001800 [Vigna angularis]|nr:hypothetical protein LR48_Vigan02g001800 [Vigna angularis]
MINAPGPCVLFATPGMISGGFSLEVFKQWAVSENNLVTLPGYCVAGTIGHKLMSDKRAKVDLDAKTRIDVRCQVHQLAFSPHTDSKGIMDLVNFLTPKHVILVHGEKHKMASLKEKIHSEFGIQCYDPANNETICISSTHSVNAEASDTFIRSCLSPNFTFQKCSSADACNSTTIGKSLMPMVQVEDERVSEGVFVVERGKKPKIVHKDELLLMLEEQKHDTMSGTF